MPGPQPLHPSVRARTNRTSTAAELESLPAAVRALLPVPELPSDRLWDPKTSDFWSAGWQSPMRLEWDAGDEHKLLMLAYVLDEFYVLAGDLEVDRLKKAASLSTLARTVIALGARLGLDPFARRSLQWLLVQTEAVEAKTENTRARTSAERSLSASKSVRQKRGLKGLE